MTQQSVISRTTSRRTPTVLVIENHEDVREIVGSMVVDQGWRALKAATIADALAYLDREEIDAIVSDWELDDGEGAQILRRARAGHTPPIPTVIISSYASPQLVAQARADGALDMLAKPFRVEELTDLLSRQLK